MQRQRACSGTAHPPWLRVRLPSASVHRMENLLARLRVHTVCKSAMCPNQGECFARGTATFMILGAVCTRNCAFCAVAKGRPEPVDPEEPERVACAARALGLRHVVITSPTRDDLPDGGASQFAATIRAVKALNPETTVEVLVPDFGGRNDALLEVVLAGPQVVNHNLETVPRLYRLVRPKASYRRSLDLLARVKEFSPMSYTKSGIMLGLGETPEEVIQTMKDLRKVKCDVVTLGQYLRPSPDHLPVAEYVSPARFAWYRKKGEELGFSRVIAGPLVRSSFRADEIFGIG